MPEIAITDLKKLLEDVEVSGYQRDKVDTSIFNKNPVFYGQPGSSRCQLLQKRFYTLCRNSLSNYCKLMSNSTNFSTHTMLPNYKQKKCKELGVNLNAVNQALLNLRTDTKSFGKCQETVNTGVSHLSRLLGGREGFLTVINQTILTRTVPTIYLRDSS